MHVRNDEGTDSKNWSECKVNIPVAAAVMPTGSWSAGTGPCPLLKYLRTQAGEDRGGSTLKGELSRLLPDIRDNIIHS